MLRHKPKVLFAKEAMRTSGRKLSQAEITGRVHKNLKARLHVRGTATGTKESRNILRPDR